MSPSRGQIAVVLPYPELCRPGSAGSVALCARDFALNSRYRDRFVFFGGPKEGGFEDIVFHGVETGPFAVGGRTRVYGARLARRFRAERPALIEIHSRPSLALQLARALPDIPITLHLHNDPQQMKRAKTPEERAALLRAARRVYCVSDYIRGRFLDGLPDDPRAATVHNGAAPAPVAPEAKRPIVAYVGRIIPDKGVLELAQAAAQVLPAHPHWTLVLAGGSTFAAGTPPTPYEEAVRAALAPLGAQARVLGHVPHDEAMALFAEAEIAVAPSLWEDPFPRVAVEALARGCAVIGAARGGLPEALAACGRLYEPAADGALSEALVQVLGDQALRRDLQRRAREAFPFPIAEMTARLDAHRADVLDGDRLAA